MKLVSLNSLSDSSPLKFKMETNLSRRFLKLGFNIFLSIPVKDIPEDIYSFSSEQKKKNLLLIGSGAQLLWDTIQDKASPDFLDKHTLESFNVIEDQEKEILFPHENIFFPLQKLARFLNFSHQSPIGLDISKEFGLWFAFRGVVLTSEALELTMHLPYSSPCSVCANKECLTVADLTQARLLCPYMSEQKYSDDQIIYHSGILKKLKKSFFSSKKI